MASRHDLTDWVLEALRNLGGSASVLEVCKEVWKLHESELRRGDLFYTWQYDIRWAALVLRKKGKMAGANDAARGIWALKGRAQ